MAQKEVIETLQESLNKVVTIALNALMEAIDYQQGVINKQKIEIQELKSKLEIKPE